MSRITYLTQGTMFMSYEISMYQYLCGYRAVLLTMIESILIYSLRTIRFIYIREFPFNAKTV